LKLNSNHFGPVLRVWKKKSMVISVAKVHPVAIAGYHGFLEDGI